MIYAMNREIKFRVWSKSLKKFEDLSNFWVRPDDFLTCFMEWRPDFDGEMVFETEKTDFIYQQFTGLKDMNGKEIYEGDIVKYKRGYSVTYEIPKGVFRSEVVEQGEYVGEIIFIFPSFCWSYDHKKGDDIEPLHLARDRYEVIGNIFQNPELLN